MSQVKEQTVEDVKKAVQLLNDNPEFDRIITQAAEAIEQSFRDPTPIMPAFLRPRPVEEDEEE